MKVEIVKCWIKRKLLRFDNYETNIDGVVKNKRRGNKISVQTDKDGYKWYGLYKDGRQWKVYIHRMLISTFTNIIPKEKETVDHKNRNRDDNTMDNLNWKSSTEQHMNQERSKTQRNAFIIVKDGVEKTAKEWAEIEGLAHTTIKKYARNNINGFSNKKYIDIPNEKWMYLENRNMVSDQGRYAIFTSVETRKVMSPNELNCMSGYPTIGVNNEDVLLHIAIFKTFKPEEYANMQTGHVIRHLNDDPMDCRLENLAIGTRSQNGVDAHDNGKFEGTKSERKKCVCINVKTGEQQKFISQTDAMLWLQRNGHPKACKQNISKCIAGMRKTAYGYVFYKQTDD